MKQLKDTYWTAFQIDAEIEHFGVHRIVTEQNRLLKLVKELAELKEALVDHAQCATCKKWKHVDDMLRPNENTEDLCCDEECCDSWYESKWSN